MRPDLLVVVHPWTSARGRVDTPATTGEQQYVYCTSGCALFINARTLRDLDGVVMIVPPVGFVVTTFTPPLITGDTLRLDLRTMPKCERYPANMMCLSVPSSAVRTTSCPISTLNVEDVDGSQGNPFELRRNRKGVPYQLGASGSAHPSAAAAVLPDGSWACRVGPLCHNMDAVVGSAAVDDGAESPTATVIMSRKGHRRATVDRALWAVSETVAEAWVARCTAGR